MVSILSPCGRIKSFKNDLTHLDGYWLNLVCAQFKKELPRQSGCCGGQSVVAALPAYSLLQSTTAFANRISAAALQLQQKNFPNHPTHPSPRRQPMISKGFPERQVASSRQVAPKSSPAASPPPPQNLAHAVTQKAGDGGSQARPQTAPPRATMLQPCATPQRPVGATAADYAGVTVGAAAGAAAIAACSTELAF